MNFREVFEKFAEKGTFQVRFATHTAGVDIPRHLYDDGVCRLNFSKLFAPGGMGDLIITDNVIQQTLSFGG